jgi:hypothetical protein
MDRFHGGTFVGENFAFTTTIGLNQIVNDSKCMNLGRFGSGLMTRGRTNA